MKTRPKKSQANLSEEYVGDDDRAFRLGDLEFPLLFLSKRFAGSGWDGYLIRNSEEYQKCLFNDEFASLLTPTFNAESLKKAKGISKELLIKQTKV